MIYFRFKKIVSFSCEKVRSVLQLTSSLTELVQWFSKRSQILAFFRLNALSRKLKDLFLKMSERCVLSLVILSK